MKKIVTLLLVSVCLNVSAQADTTLVKKQKGFLFLSGYNINYDINTSEIKSYGFSDYFFPSENFNKNCFLDSNKIISFKNGVRVEVFKSRNQLKSKAMKFNSTNIQCYFYDSFYVIPIIVDYKLFDDISPLDCRSEVFDIDVVKGSKLIFYHQRKAMLPTKIIVILPNSPSMPLNSPSMLIKKRNAGASLVAGLL
ncbi:MAG TPA: hypothetical protein VFW07_09500 [Parafilimonas sp.]|nr:hypothetical protein [Parafilimonas sp.]